MKVRVFTVFHRRIDERLIFDRFQQSEVEDYFTLYGVNATWPEKIVTKLDGRICGAGSDVSNLILEYQLPWHDATIQARGFMDTSCYVHLYKNALHESLDYVGVAQYDMRWTASAAALVRELVRSAQANPPRNTVYGLICGILMNGQRQFHPLAVPDMCHWGFLLQSYNRFFNRNWDGRILIDKPFTLWQTYLLPRHVFSELASWLSVLCQQLYPWANQPPYPTHWGHLAGIAERAESLFIAARLAEGLINLEPMDLNHDESIAQELAVSKDHYGSTTGDR